MSTSVGFADVSFSSARAWPLISEVHFALHEQKHDVVTIVVPQDTPDAHRYESDRPVAISWGNSVRRKSNWYGYINHVQSAYTSQDGSAALKVVCIGTTSVFRDEHSRQWKKRTIPSVIQEIATKQRFRVVMDPHAVVWPSLTQHGESDWKFMNSLAERIGYTLFAVGTTLYLRLRTKALKTPADVVPVLSTLDHSLDLFKPVTGATAPQGGDLASREVWGVDPRRNVAFYKKTQPSVAGFGAAAHTATRTRTVSRAVTSLEEAGSVLTGLAEANRLYLTATASAAGDARVRAGSVVFVKDVSAGDCGFWYVTAADHSVVGHRHSMSLLLGRDSAGSANVLTPPIMQTSSTPPGSRLMGQTWVA